MQPALKSNLLFTGTQVNYYKICKRKLWLHSNHISMEHTSDKVAMGKLLHETTYKRSRKEIQLDKIKIDFMENNATIHEIKLSKKLEDAHIYQTLYYIYYLKQKGVNATAVLDYPKLRKKLNIELTQEKEIELKQILEDIEKIIKTQRPPAPIRLPYCKSCSYYDLCWI